MELMDQSESRKAPKELDPIQPIKENESDHTEDIFADFSPFSESSVQRTREDSVRSYGSTTTLDEDEDWSLDIFDAVPHANSSTKQKLKKPVKLKLRKSFTKNGKPNSKKTLKRAASTSFLPHLSPKTESASSLQQEDGKVLVLEYMKKGMTLVKFGQRSKPHFRPFFLSSDNERFLWISKGKSTTRTQVFLKDITAIQDGFASGYLVSKEQVEQLGHLSSTIYYDNGAKSIVVVSKTCFEKKILVAGIEHLILEVSKGPLVFCSDFYIEQDDESTNEKCKILTGKVMRDRFRLQATLNKIQNKFAELEDESMNLGLIQSKQHEFILSWVDKIRPKMNLEIDLVPLKVADYYVWDTEVDIFCLSQVLGAV